MAAFPPFSLAVELPCVMGILNVTPDSFSDGGRFHRLQAAVAQASLMASEGAAIIDVGGESTRPGSDPVTLDEELRRTMPVIERLRADLPAPVSIDTMKAEVARRALQAGAVLVNDVSALRSDPAMAAVVAESGCAVCLMHMQGEPKTMQDDPRYANVVSEVTAFLEQRLAFAVASGIREEQVLLDPGIGFGKTAEHNLLLLKHLDRLAALGRPLVLGASRKRFIGTVLGVEPRERVVGTVATTVLGVLAGVAVFRVHDVRPNVEALRLTRAVLSADGGEPSVSRLDITITVRGVELFGRCGVTAEERAQPQRLLVDVSLVPRDVAGVRTDDLADTLDYGRVVAIARQVVEGGEHRLLERIAALIANRVWDELRPRETRVTVTKPAPPVSVPTEAAAAEAVRRE